MSIAHSKPAVHRFDKACKRLGIDPTPSYLALKIAPADMKNEKHYLPMPQFLALLEHIAQSTNKRFFGAELATSLEYTEMGVLAYMLRSAKNLSMMLDLLQRYIALVAPGARVQVLQDANSYTLTYKHLDFEADATRQDVESTITQFIFLIQQLLDCTDWLPEKVHFEHSPLSKSDAKEFPFCNKVYFNQAYSGVVFPTSIIHYPVPTADLILLKILESQFIAHNEFLSQQRDFPQQVNVMVTASIGMPENNAEAIAKALGISRRTLNRRLQECGTTYKTLREEALIEIASKALVNTTTPITTLAHDLGYADASAFNRLFKRLTGSTPLQYRKQRAQR